MTRIKIEDWMHERQIYPFQWRHLSPNDRREQLTDAKLDDLLQAIFDAGYEAGGNDF